jgi:hypothetical protein
LTDDLDRSQGEGMTLAMLQRALDDLTPAADPDGPQARGALLLAARTTSSAAAAATSDAASWDMSHLALRAGYDELQGPTPDDLILDPDLPDVDGAAPGLRDVVNALVHRLADLYAGAAAGDTGSPWRRTVWASVAQRLDEAAVELTG